MVTRVVVLALVAGAIVAAAFAFSRSYRKPDSGREANVADAPAGGRTQAQESPADSGAGAIAVEEIRDPLVAGIPEAPDIPPSDAHKGLKKMGVRIREAVLADGTVGDDEAPGIAFTGLTQAQRRWFLDRAVDITCGCGCNQDLLECRRDDVMCPRSPVIRDSLLAEARKR
ncbi:MAG: hypothetical protein ACREOU_08830 [Candidatus Eiseniibacteriota bacterium]